MPTYHPLLLPPKMKSIRDQFLESVGGPNPVNVEKLDDIERRGASERRSTSLKLV